jgi:hypothetical protein
MIHRVVPLPPHSRIVVPSGVHTYEVTLKDRTIELVDGADAYQQEGQMTTFFATKDSRQVVDCWSSRVASFRTSEILIVRRADRPGTHADAADANQLAGSVPVAPDGSADPRLHLRSA